MAGSFPQRSEGNVADINDYYDQQYMNDPNYAWDKAQGQWVPNGGSGQKEAIIPLKEPPRAPAPGRVVPENNSSLGQGPALFQVDPSIAQFDKSWESESKRLLGQVQGRPDVGLNTVQADATRMFQQGLLQQLQGQATGTGPSLADAQLRKASDQNLANTLSSIQATRGMGATAAAANAAGAGAQAGQQLAQDSAIVRLQEQMQAQGLLGQLATGTRGQDIGQAAQAANIEMQNRAQRDQTAAQLIRDGMGAAQAQTQANIQVAGMNQQGAISGETMRQAREQFDLQLAEMQRQFNRKMSKEEAEMFWRIFSDGIKMVANAAGGATGAGNITG